MLSEVELFLILIFNFQIFVDYFEYFGVQLINGTLA